MSGPNFIKPNRGSKYLIPEFTVESIREDDPVVFIHDYCSRLPLDIFNYRKDGKGKPQFDPRDVLTLILLCYSKGWFSSRKLEEASRSWDQGKYIFGRNWIDHSTICRITGKNKRAFATLLANSQLEAEMEGFLDLSEVLGDSTKFKAYAGSGSRTSLQFKDSEKFRKKLEKEYAELLKLADEVIDVLMNDLNMEDQVELAELFVSLRKKAERVRRDLKKLERAKENLVEEAVENVRYYFFKKKEAEFLEKFNNETEAKRLELKNLDEWDARLDAKEKRLQENGSSFSPKQYQRRAKDLKSERRALRKRRKAYSRSLKSYHKRYQKTLRPVTMDDLNNKERRNLRRAINRAKVDPEKYMNLTDPDCRLQRFGNTKAIQYGFSLQLAVDKTGRFILDTFVTGRENDSHELRPMVERVTELFDAVRRFVLDAGYWAGHEIDIVEYAGFEPVVPSCKTTDTEPAQKMREKLEHKEYAESMKNRKLVERTFAHLKANLRRGLTYHKGLDMVQTICTLTSLSINLTTTMKLKKQREQEEKARLHNIDVEEQKRLAVIAKGEVSRNILNTMLNERGMPSDLFALKPS